MAARQSEFLTRVLTTDQASRIEANFVKVQETQPPSANEIKTHYFDRMTLGNTIEPNHGDTFTIDVQPDCRFLFHYISYAVCELYPESNYRNHSAVSPFSLSAYATALHATQLLINDLYARHDASVYAQPYSDVGTYSDLLDVLVNLKVPAFIADIIECLNNFKDAQRLDLQFCISLAASIFPHDCGRLIPSNLWLAIHDIIAKQRGSINIDGIIAEIYRTVLINYGNHDFTVSNLFGGPYQHNNQSNLHRNWLNKMFDKTVRHRLGTYLTTRPSFSRIEIRHPTMTHQNYNPYSYMLFGHPNNVPAYKEMMLKISRYVESVEPSALTILQLQSKLNYIYALHHSIEPVTLPTWHAFPNIPPATARINLVNDTNYATTVGFLTPRRNGTAQLPYPQAPAPADLYLVRRSDHRTQQAPYQYIEFDASEHVAPGVFWLQPYDKRPTALSKSLVLGFKIEFAEFDGVQFNLPNFEASLVDNNSHFRQGSIPVFFVKPYRPITGQDHALHLVKRKLNKAGACGFTIRDASINVLPRFDNKNVSNTVGTIKGFKREEHHDDSHHMFTRFSYSHKTPNERIPLVQNQFYLWSSYRHVTNNGRPSSANTSMYVSIHPFYGSSTTLSSTDNPSTLLP